MTSDAVRASAWHQAAIERIVVQTPRVKSFFLRTPLRPHVAGQHLDVRLTAKDGYQAQRAYSIASAPGDAIELAIEELADWSHAPRTSYVCGADAFVEDVTKTLVTQGLPPQSVRAERYGGPARDAVDKPGLI